MKRMILILCVVLVGCTQERPTARQTVEAEVYAASVIATDNPGYVTTETNTAKEVIPLPIPPDGTANSSGAAIRDLTQRLATLERRMKEYDAFAVKWNAWRTAQEIRALGAVRKDTGGTVICDESGCYRIVH